MKKILSALIIILSTSTFATDHSDLNRFKSITDLGFNITETIKIPSKGLEGFELIKVGRDWIIAKPGSNFVMKGDIIDLNKRESVVDELKKPFYLNKLTTYPSNLKISYKPNENIKTQSTITVFTDTSCPFCQKLHAEIPALNNAGIQVDYIPYPRSYPNGRGYSELVSIWCSDDQVKAMDETMLGTSLNSEKCLTQAVSRGYQLSNSLGLTGTPAIFTENGLLISGFLPANKLITTIDADNAIAK